VKEDSVDANVGVDLAPYTFMKFPVNSDTHNKSKIIQVKFKKAEDKCNFWTLNVKSKHGVIVWENIGELEVIRDRSLLQLFSLF